MRHFLIFYNYQSLTDSDTDINYCNEIVSCETFPSISFIIDNINDTYNRWSQAHDAYKNITGITEIKEDDLKKIQEQY